MEILSLVDRGFSNDEILKKLADGTFIKSETIKLKGKEFCSKCESEINLNYCTECFQIENNGLCKCCLMTRKSHGV
jgi:hypothetical protein